MRLPDAIVCLRIALLHTDLQLSYEALAGFGVELVDLARALLPLRPTVTAWGKPASILAALWSGEGRTRAYE